MRKYKIEFQHQKSKNTFGYYTYIKSINMKQALLSFLKNNDNKIITYFRITKVK